MQKYDNFFSFVKLTARKRERRGNYAFYQIVNFDAGFACWQVDDFLNSKFFFFILYS